MEDKKKSRSDSTTSSSPMIGQLNIQDRNWIGFFILGLSNTFVHMYTLLVAYKVTESSLFKVEDTSESAAAFVSILVADVLPSLVVKSIAPFTLKNKEYRILTVILTALTSLVTMSFARTSGGLTFGVISASFSAALGEVTILTYTADFTNSNMIPPWSSGTGCGKLLAIVLFLLLTKSISIRFSVLIMFIFPALMGISFWSVIRPPAKPDGNWIEMEFKDRKNEPEVEEDEEKRLQSKAMIIIGQIWWLFFPYLMSLGFIFFFDFFLRQGLCDYLLFPASIVPYRDQRVMFEVISLLGICIGRTSIHFIQITKRVWILPVIQGVFCVFFVIEIMTPFLGYLTVVNFALFFHNLIAGSAYGNVFLSVSLKADKEHKSFNLAFTPITEPIGVILAALVVRR